MNNIEQDIKVLTKVLNSELILNKYPMILGVSVTKYGDGIDIIIFLNESKLYWDVRNEIVSFFWKVSKMVGVTSNLNIYP